MRRLVLTLLAAWPAALGAQTPYLAGGRFFADTARNVWRAGLTTKLAGPLGLGVDATMLGEEPGLPAAYGGEADLSLFRGGRPGLYLVGSYGGGIVGSTDSWWHGWSAGAGLDLYPFSWLTMAFEGRWRVYQPGNQEGIEATLRLGFGGHDHRRLATPAPNAPPAKTVATASARDQLIASVLSTAREAMGTPYKWGGAGASGFDCSGLIQYAYSSQGVILPRRSSDQAREGTAVDRSLDTLMPGDILTFSGSENGTITHVGLYLGDGRFIHSASAGVTISLLSPEDSYGRWWYQRWVGARRVVALPGR